MSQWQPAAERLRAVRRASALFMDLWILGELKRKSTQIDRIAADVNSQHASALKSHEEHDWSILYRGDILDD